MKAKSYSSRRQHIAHWLAVTIAAGVGILLALVPFHAALVVVLGARFGHASVMAAWKDVMIVLLGGLALAYWPVSGRWPWRFDGPNLAAAFLIVLGVVVSLALHVSRSALGFGVAADLLPLVLFLAAQVALRQLSVKHISWLVLAPAGLVAAGAVAQAYFAPIDWLSRLGYGLNTINPVQIVDGSLKLLRSFSTLGGPNQLGAYLIIPICLALSWLIRERKFYVALLIPLLSAGLVLSYSRSAWLGALVAVVITILLCVPRTLKLIFAVITLTGVLVLGLAVSRTIHSTTITNWQHILLHGRNFNNQIQSADTARLSAARTAVHDITHHPLGFGLGTAGPASQHAGITRITEDWYLQIGLELGWLGLAAYAVLFSWLFVELIRGDKAQRTLNFALAGSLAGILVACLFLHALADSTLSIMLFGLLGLTRRRPV